jgi:hypothetical protein
MTKNKRSKNNTPNNFADQTRLAHSLKAITQDVNQTNNSGESQNNGTNFEI